MIRGQPGWIDGNAGVTLQALGRLVAHDWRAGIVPWWNPYSGVGMPLAGEMQPGAFFLPFVLLLGWDDGLLYLKITLQILSGLFTWGLLRALGLRRGPALLGAVLFEFNGIFAWAADSPTLPIAFLPLLLWGIERAAAASRAGVRQAGVRQGGVRQGGVRQGWAMIAVALAYALLAGFPETAYIDGLLGLAWAILRLAQARGHRTGFALRVGFGGVIGVLLASPLLAAFISFLQQSTGGRQLGHFPYPPGLFAQFLLPYAYGPIFFGGRVDWYLLEGYCGVSVMALALAALAGAAPRGARALCWLLGAWVAACAGKIANLPVVTGLWNAVPLIDQTLFFRYAVPSCAFCLIVLASLAFERMWGTAEQAATARAAPRWWRAGLAGCALCGVLCVLALWAGRPIWRDLGSVPGGRAWFFAALALGAACLAMLGAVFARGAAGRWRHVLAAALLGEALVNFTIPVLSGTRGAARHYDTGLVDFLRPRLGQQRFYTLGPFAPNYGAYFGLASINHDYAPLPSAWIEFIHARLDPGADATTFSGTSPVSPPPLESRTEAFARRIPDYAAIGVKYVLTPHRTAFSAAAPAESGGTRVAAALRPGQWRGGTFPPGAFPDGAVTRASLVIGTYFGHATGSLRLRLCEAGACASGEAVLDHAADNAPLVFRLSPALRHHAQPISFEITHVGGVSDVAVWLAAGALPALELLVQPDFPALPLVYEDSIAEVFELPDPAPYFRVSPACVLTVRSRETLEATCSATSRLTRAELSFEGWRAAVNGAPVPVGRDGVFQTVDLPAGRSRVEFWFWPPFETLACLAWGLGVLVLTGGMFFFEKKNQKTFIPLGRFSSDSRA